MNEKYKAPTERDMDDYEVNISAGTIPQSAHYDFVLTYIVGGCDRWRRGFEAAINEILAADRAARPFAPDPRIVQLAKLQRLAGVYMGDLSNCPEELVDALVALATDPIIGHREDAP